MSTSISHLPVACRDCSSELSIGALVCHECRTLVYQDELEGISGRARELEAQGKLREAHDEWQRALLLLPGLSKQADWIRTHAGELKVKADEARMPEGENPWARKLGPIGPVAIVLAKSKMILTAIFKLKFLLSFAAFIGLYWTLYGAKFGLGFAVMILIHEMGHFLDIKRRGLPADMPVFLPGFGAYVRWQALGVSLETRAAVSLAGPLAGLLASLSCLWQFQRTGDPLRAALASTGAALNLLNLIPVWVLDGGQAATALSRAQRLVLLSSALILWLLLGQGLFAYRLFTKDLPAQPNWLITVYFVALLVMLGFVIDTAPLPRGR
jgi:Zn-dependent protease